MKVLDLFSGIGGMSLGLERAGMETVAFCENDIHCQKVLKKHWPDIPIFNDVTKLKAKNINQKIDLICGGFPCQDISVAGNKKGIKDGTRSGLWKEFARIIKEVKPRYVIIENVANLRNLGLNQVIEDLWKIGYVGEWHIISARAVGACHLRERIWIIAYPYSIGQQESWTHGPQVQSGESEVRKSENVVNGSTDTGVYVADTERERYGRIQSGWSSRANREETLRTGWLGQERGVKSPNPNIEGMEGREFNGQKHPCQKHEVGSITGNSPNSHLPRFWQAFETQEERREWWSEATARFRDWWQIESGICRVDDGLPKGMDRLRRERIKQLGNSVVPFIPELIGRAIMEHERG